MFDDHRSNTQLEVPLYSPQHITTTDVYGEPVSFHGRRTNVIIGRPEPDSLRSGSTSTSHATRSMKATEIPIMLVPSDAANGSVPSGQGYASRGKTATTQDKGVHWASRAVSHEASPLKGILQYRNIVPRYNLNCQTATFTLHVKFGEACRVVPYRQVTMRANLLLLFEVEMLSRFPEASRTELSKSLTAGYAIVLFTRGFRTRTIIPIRGTAAVLPDAAFTGFLNSVHDGARVLLEWA
jgi:hypothetical protein